MDSVNKSNSWDEGSLGNPDYTDVVGDGKTKVIWKMDSENQYRSNNELLKENLSADARFGSLLKLFSNSNSMLCIVDFDGNFELVNPAFSKILGYTEQELLSSPYTSFIHPDDVERTIEEANKLASKSSDSIDFINRYRTKCGDYRYFSWHAKSHLEDKKIYCTAIDITENHQRSLALYEKTLYLNLTEHIAGLGYWRLELDSKFVSWSDEVFRIHDLPVSDKAPPLSDCLDFYHSDDRAKIEKLLAQAFSEHRPFTFKYRIITAKGKLKYVLSEAQIERDENRQPKAIFGTFQDITEEVQAQEELHRLSEVVKHAHISVLVCNKERKIMWVNDGFERLTGYSKLEAIGQYPSALLQGPETSSEAKEQIRQRLRNCENVDAELINYTKQGEAYWIRLSITPIFDDDGEVMHYLGIQTDITQTKRQNELMQQASHLESLNFMVGGIAHDFNNMLNIAKSNLEHLENTSQNSPDNLNHIQKADRAIEKAASLTQKLLRFAKTFQSEMEPCCIDDSIEDIYHLLDKSFAKGALLEINQLEPQLWCNLNKSDFQDCIINLALNARDAMQDMGKLEISIATGKPIPDFMTGYLPTSPLHQDYCQIVLKDNGCGIKLEDLEKVFTPFFTTKPLGQGTGLGLSMVYNFIRHSQGYIGINSYVGKGTEVTLWLPLTPKPADLKVANPESDRKLDHSLNILLLDDEEDLLDITSTLLKSSGHTVTCCSGAEQALEEAKQKTFDVFLSDILMAGTIQPKDVIKELQISGKPTKIMLMSGYQGSDNEDLLDYPILQKPFSKNVLLQSVQNLHEEKPLDLKDH